MKQGHIQGAGSSVKQSLSPRPESSTRPAASAKPAAPGKQTQPAPKSSEQAARASTLILAVVYCLFVSGMLYLVLRLPGAPSNVKELFLFGGTLFDLLLFSLALLWLGFGSAWLGWRASRSMHPGLLFPVLACSVSIVLYLLLTFSVTDESMNDITGAQIWVERIYREASLGQVGVSFVSLIGEGSLSLVVEPLETVVRLGALVGPVLMFIGIGSAANYRRRHSPRPLIKYEMHSYGYWVGRYLLYALPWLLFCHLITYRWASTDNISSLLEPGLVGMMSLYGLMLLLTISAFFIAWLCSGMDTGGVGPKNRFWRATLTLLIAVGSIPFGWWLLNGALVDVIIKEGYQYSGLDFLLGPDRSELISRAELGLRWTVLQFVGILVLAFGIYLFLRLVKSVKPRGYATGQDAEDKAYVRANLSSEQVGFLSDVALNMATDQSGVLASILDQLEANIAREHGRHWVMEMLKTKEDQRLEDLSMSSRLHLSTRHMQMVQRLGRDARLTESRVVRRAVTWFMQGCSEPD